MVKTTAYFAPFHSSADSTGTACHPSLASSAGASAGGSPAGSGVATSTEVSDEEDGTASVGVDGVTWLRGRLDDMVLTLAGVTLTADNGLAVEGAGISGTDVAGRSPAWLVFAESPCEVVGSTGVTGSAEAPATNCSGAIVGVGEKEA